MLLLFMKKFLFEPVTHFGPKNDASSQLPKGPWGRSKLNDLTKRRKLGKKKLVLKRKVQNLFVQI